MWGTLSRFKAESKTPYSHILVSGRSSFVRGQWNVRPTVKRTNNSLMEILIKALLIKGFSDPNAGAGEIEAR
jgi:hypothetical protein